MKNQTDPTSAAQATALEQLLIAYAEFHSPEAVRRHADRKEQAEAVAAADRWVDELPLSLAEALGEVADRWTAFPAFHLEVYVPAAAVAYLGHGVWIHHAWWPAEPGFGGDSEATLLAPCGCGQGYQQFEASTQDELVGALAVLSGAPRPDVHSDVQPDCDEDGSCRSTFAS
ncbi:hypothetical protein ACFVHW_07870 [Streptomyces sp. NPDC127110]|uniref:hypothetical protein n=1 Tax=Streptomyces sp. NPDC127110 TaxID=3345362 RepID=UPI00363206A8